MSEAPDEAGPSTAVVLDVLPHGRADDDRPRYRKSPLAQAIRPDGFRLQELVLDDGGRLAIGDEAQVDPVEPPVEVARSLSYDDLSTGARSELEHVVRELVDADESRVVEFYNEAGPVTLRLHQLNLLPGVGDKLRDNIIDARKRRPFESLDDIDERVSGLHDPKGTVVERVLEELRDEDVKYKLFVRDREAATG
jgi:putative nucleotide binding protein